MPYEQPQDRLRREANADGKPRYTSLERRISSFAGETCKTMHTAFIVDVGDVYSSGDMVPADEAVDAVLAKWREATDGK